MQKQFALIENPRQQRYMRHKLYDILTMVMCAVICGLDELGMVVTIRNRATFFKENFGIPSVPSKATFNRVLRMIDGEKVAKIMVSNWESRVRFWQLTEKRCAAQAKMATRNHHRLSDGKRSCFGTGKNS